MHSGAGDTTQLVPGYPIRTPWDHSLVDSSPRPIAASHVLHRLLVPRHPPSALDNLTTKMLASTIQFSTNDPPTPPTTPTNTGNQTPGPQPHPRTQHQPVWAPGMPDHTKTPNTPPTPTGDRHARLLFQNLNRVSCTTPTSRTTTTFHTHPHQQTRGRAVLAAAAVAGSHLRQCLRHRAPPPHIRRRRAPYPLSREGAP
jgi:hypothetical protein